MIHTLDKHYQAKYFNWKNLQKYIYEDFKCKTSRLEVNISGDTHLHSVPYKELFFDVENDRLQSKMYDITFECCILFG